MHRCFHGTARAAGFAIAFALHAAALAALLAYQPAREAMLAAVPIMVNLVQPPQVKPAPPPPEPPKPKPGKRVERPPLTPPPIVTAPAEAPSPVVAPPPPPPAPIVASPAPAPVVVPPPAPPSPLPVTQPIFNADYLDNPAPAFPSLSRRLGEQGRVVLRVLVSAAGSAHEIQVRTSSGYERLDAAALEAVKRWKFIPAKRGEEPVAAWVLIPISFRLDS